MRQIQQGFREGEILGSWGGGGGTERVTTKDFYLAGWAEALHDFLWERGLVGERHRDYSEPVL